MFLRVFEASFKGDLKKFQGSFRRLVSKSAGDHGRFKGGSRVVQISYKMLFQRFFKEVKR